MTDTTQSFMTLQPGEVPDIGKPPSFLERMMPKSFSELVTFAGIVAKAGWAPLSYRKDVPKNHAGARVGRPEDQDLDPDKILIGMLMGAEVGLQPLTALQNIAVINGIPAVYGNAMLGLVERANLLEDFSEVQMIDITGVVTGWTITAKRKGRPTPIVRTFTIDNAKKANLWGKQGPWTQYPQRMLQMRARGLCLNDGFSDVLKGLRIIEEAQDIPMTITTLALAAPAPKSAKGKLDAFADTPTMAKPEDAEFTEEGHDPVTGEVQEEASGLPDEIQAAFDAAKFTPFLQWLDMELQKLAEAPDVKQGLVDRHAARLKTVHDSGKGGEAAVIKLVTAFEVTVDFIAAEVA